MIWFANISVQIRFNHEASEQIVVKSSGAREILSNNIM